MYKNAPFYATLINLPEAASDCGLPEISLFIQCLSESGLKVFENTKDRFEAVREDAIAGRGTKNGSLMMHMMALQQLLVGQCSLFILNATQILVPFVTKKFCHRIMLQRNETSVPIR